MNWHESDGAGRTDGPAGKGRYRRLRPSGGYRELRSFQVATAIYDATVAFCDRFVDPKSRLRDQMVHAARSGKQNIAEGSRASATTSQTELRLVNVARASLDELLLDYEDFLRQRGLRQWAKGDPEAREVRNWHRTDQTEQTDQTYYSRWLGSPDPDVVANAGICLFHQANFLLDQQTADLERGFVKQGGYSEQLAAARIAEQERRMTDPTDRSDRTDRTLPNCPLCGKPMTLRTARKGPRAGKMFLGCTGFPACKGTRSLDGSDGSGRQDR